MSGPSDPPGGTSSSSSTFEPGGSERTWVGDEEASAEVLAERYTTMSELGRGAIGIVERVYDAHLDRAVARKRLLDDRPASHRSFVREARVTAALGHPGIPPVYDLGVDDERVPFYTMQEIVGRPWKELVQEATSLEARLAQLDVLLAVARAVAHAHEQGLVHRDLKLSNVMIGPLGDVFVVDWGLCVPTGHDGPPAGTPQYMSPEQARGETVTQADDVWALGVILFRLLTGRAPHDAPSAKEVVERAKRGAIPDVRVLAPEAPVELLDMVRKATAIDREARYPDASAFAADLKAFLQGNWVTAHQYTVRELTRRLWDRHRRRVFAGAAVVALIAAAVVSAVLAIREERDRAVAAEARALLQLASALEANAAAAPADRWEPQAELAAAQALVLDPDRPVAWGVLVRHARTDHPTLAWSLDPPCPAVAAQDETLILDCDGQAHLARLHVDGTAGPHRPIRSLPPLAAGHEQVQYVLSDHLLARGLPGVGNVVDLDTDAPIHDAEIERSSTYPVAGYTRDGTPGVLLRGKGADLWSLTGEGADDMVYIGTPPPFASMAADGPHIYLRNLYKGVFHCATGPLHCRRAIPGDDVSVVDADHGWVVAAHAKGGVTVARAPQPGDDPATTDRVRLPTDAGVHTQLLVLEDHFAGLRTDGDVDVWHLDGRAVARLPTGGIAPGTLAAHGPHLLILGEEVQAWELGQAAYANVPSVPGGLGHRDGAPVLAAIGGVVLHTEPPIVGPTPADVVKDLDVLPDGRVVYSVIRADLTIWDPVTGATERQGVGDLTDSARRVATTSGGDVILIDYARRIRRVTPGAGAVEVSGSCWGDLARSEDRRALMCGMDNRLLQLDPDTGEVLRELAAEKDAIWAIGVAPDASEVLYALRDGTLVRIDLTTERRQEHPSGHEGNIASIAYSPDGRYVATGSWDQRIHVYDASDLRLAAVLEGHTGRVVEVDFASPTELASISWDEMLWRWDLSVLDQPPEVHLARVRSEVGLQDP